MQQTKRGRVQDRRQVAAGQLRKIGSMTGLFLPVKIECCMSAMGSKRAGRRRNHTAHERSLKGGRKGEQQWPLHHRRHRERPAEHLPRESGC